MHNATIRQVFSETEGFGGCSRFCSAIEFSVGTTMVYANIVASTFLSGAIFSITLETRSSLFLQGNRHYAFQNLASREQLGALQGRQRALAGQLLEHCGGFRRSSLVFHVLPHLESWAAHVIEWLRQTGRKFFSRRRPGIRAAEAHENKAVSHLSCRISRRARYRGPLAVRRRSLNLASQGKTLDPACGRAGGAFHSSINPQQRPS